MEIMLMDKLTESERDKLRSKTSLPAYEYWVLMRSQTEYLTIKQINTARWIISASKAMLENHYVFDDEIIPRPKCTLYNTLTKTSRSQKTGRGSGTGRKRMLVTPDGVFETHLAAALHFKVNQATISQWKKTKSTLFFTTR